MCFSRSVDGEFRNELLGNEEVKISKIDFAARIGKVVDALPGTRLARHIAGQLIRRGTSPVPNYAEACAAESKRNFIHKLGIAIKELRESRSWIKLILKTELLPAGRMSPLLDEVGPLRDIVGKRIVTAKADQQKKSLQPTTFQFAFDILHFAVLILTFSMVQVRRTLCDSYLSCGPNFIDRFSHDSFWIYAGD